MRSPDDLLIGILEIDKQHQVLFEVLGRLEAAVDADEIWSAVHFALVELADFVSVHFTVEEALMRLHDYAELESHIAEHRRFSADLVRLKTLSIRTDVSAEMITLVRTWLVGHIDVTDRAYVQHLRTAAVVRH
jgi:hemerythrin-like metal-binding protein